MKSNNTILKFYGTAQLLSIWKQPGLASSHLAGKLTAGLCFR